MKSSSLRLLWLAGLILLAAGVAAPAAEHRDFTLLAAGDIGECTSDGPFLTGKLLDRLGGEILAVGDLAYEKGSERDFMSCFDRAWGRHKERIHPVPGNHEYRSDHAAPYFRYFGEAAARPGGYYSFDVNGWHIVALNSSIDTAHGSVQERWLSADLRKATAPCVLVFMHYSYFSSGWHGRVAKLTPLVEDMYRYGVSVVLTGHDHHYERFAPVSMGGDRDDRHGIRFFVVGTGGARPYPTIWRPATSETARSGVWGVLGLNLRPGGYDWEFLPAEETDFRDAGSDRCPARPPHAALPKN